MFGDVSRVTTSLLLATLLFIGGCVSDPPEQTHSAASAIELDPQVDELQRRTFQFFWDIADPVTGLMPDRYPTEDFASIAATGFALTAYVVGVERSYVTREEARERVLKTLRFLHSAPQSDAVAGSIGYKGFFYHFIDQRTGHRFKDVELSTVDTALLLGGVLTAQSYFDGEDRPEREIRQLAEEIYGRVDWRWAQVNAPAISHGWRPERGFIPHDWLGYSEAMLVYILALGSPTHAVDADAWATWTSTYDQFWGTWFGQEHLAFAPLFGHQYSHVWIDFRGIQDDFMRGKSMDYFENSRRAVLAQRAYAMQNPRKWLGYDADVWGITACDGPADVTLPYAGEERRFISYAGRGAAGPHTLDDGTIAPTAAAASIVFTPDLSVAAIRSMRERYGQYLYSQYGFLDSFNPSFRYRVPLVHGRVVKDVGWFADDYIAIDQGPIVAMIENHRSDLIWRVMRNNPHIIRGLRRAGFTGGWLDAGATSSHDR